MPAHKYLSLQAKGIPAYYDPLVVAAAGIDEHVPAGKSFTAGWLARTRCKVLYTQAVVGSGYGIFFLTPNPYPNPNPNQTLNSNPNPNPNPNPTQIRHLLLGF